MGETLISVIIPAYNCACYISKAIESALNQGVPVEIIVINDCSSDNLEHVLEGYISNNKILYLKNDCNKGVSESRNRGVRAARGEYIAFLDSDDWWRPDKLQKQLEIMKEKKFILCYTARTLVNDDGTPTGKIIHVDETIDYNRLLCHNIISCSSVIMKRAIALDCPMSNDELHEDYLTWLKILRRYGMACGIDEPLLVYRMSSDGKSRNKIKSAKMTYRVYRKLEIGKIRAFFLMSSHLLNGIRKYSLGWDS